MNYTQNHHLPQWVKSDRIMMDDFNAAMANIESGISNAQSTASAAQSAANSARNAASAAQSTADTALSSKPYAAGTYTGTGTDLLVILGFRPAFVLINGMGHAHDTLSLEHSGTCSCATTGAGNMSQHIQFVSNGFRVIVSSSLPDLTQNGRVYEYIAFK